MISFIIVDYNTIKQTCKYIEHIVSMSSNPELYHFIIVDNYISNFGIDYLKSVYECSEEKIISGKKIILFKYNALDICYVYANDNLGYAKGNNLGTVVADELYNDDYYIVSNNDLKLNRPFDWNVFQHIFESKKDVGVIGPRVIGLDGKDQSPYKKISPVYHMIFYFWLRFWPIKAQADLSIMTENGYCYRVMGCFLILRADIFRSCGRFDPFTFMYGEEMILSERFLKNGYKNYFYHDYTIVHEHGVTVRKMSSVLQSDQWCYDSCRYYYQKYRNCPQLILKIADASYFINKKIIRLKERVKEVLRG